MSTAIGKDNTQQTENKQERATRIVESRLRAKQWYKNRVDQRERRQLANRYVIATRVEQELTTVTSGVEQELTEQELATVRVEQELTEQELTTVTPLEREDTEEQLKEQSRSVIRKLQVERAILVRQVHDIDIAISTIARTCHLRSASE